MTVPPNRVAAPLSAGLSLPADLAKLHQRYADAFPTQTDRAILLAPVPAAFRHLLGLELDLQRAGTLPQRYRALGAGHLPEPAATLDPVDRLVRSFGQALRAGRPAAAASTLERLKRFFTLPQLTELALIVSLDRSMQQLEAVFTAPPPP